jgi:hypothetical protein
MKRIWLTLVLGQSLFGSVSLSLGDEPPTPKQPPRLPTSVRTGLIRAVEINPQEETQVEVDKNQSEETPAKVVPTDNTNTGTTTEPKEDPEKQLTPSEKEAAKRISLETILGPLQSQKELFGNLKINKPAVPESDNATSIVRMEILPDGSHAAWQGDVYSWTSPGFFHNPLYFEQVNLERYGNGSHRLVQPWVSGIHFLGTIPIIPYRMGCEAWDERVYSLGHYRPGDKNPYEIHYSPYSWKGVAAQAAATSGLIFVIP